MKVNLEWLKEYTDIHDSPKEFAEKMTMSGSKVETIDIAGEEISNVVVGKILSIEKHQDSDHLVVTKVDVKDEILQIVTGANNINVNDIVPIAKVGSTLPGGVKINKGKLRGVESFGMMCSVGELGLDIQNYTNAIEDGIFILDKNYENDLGKDIKEVLKMNGVIIEFEITPNRPDCLSVYGLAKEAAITLDKPFNEMHKHLKNVNTKKVDMIDSFKVEVKDIESCPRYMAKIVKNIVIEPSPAWMQAKLKDCGIRPINNIVDITNYVLIEQGQPMHAFDINDISGSQIVVRRANDNEKIVTLDGEERVLDSNMLVIADASKAVAVAGVMGGENSEIKENTKTIVFECAMFNPKSIRYTAKKLGLRTEASARYERGLDIVNSEIALNRAIELVELLKCGTTSEETIDVYPVKYEGRQIQFNIEKINKFIGIEASEEYVLDILGKLDIKVEKNIATIPSSRLDIEEWQDLAEEIARFYGYNNIKSSLVYAESTLGRRNTVQTTTNVIKDIMVSQGLYEIYSYGFYNEEALKKSNIDVEALKQENMIISLLNPLSEDYKIMRTSTIPSIMENLSRNYARRNKQVGLFEIARIYSDNNKIVAMELPNEQEILSIGMYGEIDFYVLKGIIETVLDRLGVKKYSFETEINNSSFHPGRTANIKIGSKTIGIFGEINPKVTKNYDVNEKVYVAEIYLNDMLANSTLEREYVELPKYPSVERDIAFLMKDDIIVGEVEKTIRKAAGNFLESVELFDIYRGDKLEKGYKNVVYSLAFRAKDKTLTDSEITETMTNIVEKVCSQFGAEVRK